MNPDSCGNNDTLTIINQTDFDPLNHCTNFVGDIIIVGNSDSYTIPPSLLTVSGGIGAINIPLSKIEADSLVKVGTSNQGPDADDFIGPFALGYLPYLTTMTFPRLAFIGGVFTLTHNPALQTIDGFPALSHVNGSVVLIGNFDSVSLPSLESVGGNFHVKSSNNSFHCPFTDLQSKGGVRGTYFCGTTEQFTSMGNSSQSVTTYNPLPSSTAAVSAESICCRNPFHLSGMLLFNVATDLLGSRVLGVFWLFALGCCVAHICL